MNWIDEQIDFHKGILDKWNYQWGPPKTSEKQLKLLEALKAARKALDLAHTPRAEDRQEVLAAMAQIDGLGK